MTQEDLGLKFHFNDDERIISHWLMNSETCIVQMVAETQEFKERRETVARVTVNGVELSFADFEQFMVHFLEDEAKRLAEKYADVELEVQRRVDEELQRRADKILESMDRLQDALTDASSILKPYWEK